VITSALGSVRAGAKGDFTLSLEELKSAKPIPLALKGGKARVTSTLGMVDARDHRGRGAPCHMYAVRLEAGQVYQIDVMSEQFDSYMRIEDTAGKQLAVDDDSGGMRNARILLLCRKTETYHVIATSLNPNEFGPKGKEDPNKVKTFTMAIEPHKAQAPVELTLKDGKASTRRDLSKDAFSSRTLPGGPAHVYLLKLEAGKRYRMEMNSKKFDTYLRLEGLNAEIVAQADDGGEDLNAQLTFTCKAAGTYYLFATTYATPHKFGPYALEIKESPEGTKSPEKTKSPEGAK
jgi:serine protease Do